MTTFLERVETLFSSEDPLKKRLWQRFQELGLPSYSYLPLSQLRTFKIEAAKEAIPLQKNPDSPFGLVFVNGCFRPELSDPLSDDIVLLPLSEALQEYPAFLSSHFERQLREERESFALMTAALTDEGSFLYVPPHVTASLKIINIQTAKSSFARLEVLVGRKASCQITFKNYAQIAEPSFISELINIHLEEEASCSLFKIDSYHSKAWAFSFVRAFQKASSELTVSIATNGALSARHDIKVTLAGAEAKVHLFGIAKLKGFCQAHTAILIEHKAPDTISNQLFKSILDDVSRSSFQGEIFVSENALKTNAFQLNKSLLLSDKAIAYSRPQLQIFADDVKASHGATVGEIDEEMLFYLKSRGIPQEIAKQMLLESFANDVLSSFSEPLSHNEAAKLLA